MEYNWNLEAKPTTEKGRSILDLMVQLKHGQRKTKPIIVSPNGDMNIFYDVKGGCLTFRNDAFIALSKQNDSVCFPSTTPKDGHRIPFEDFYKAATFLGKNMPEFNEQTLRDLEKELENMEWITSFDTGNITGTIPRKIADKSLKRHCEPIKLKFMLSNNFGSKSFAIIGRELITSLEDYHHIKEDDDGLLAINRKFNSGGFSIYGGDKENLRLHYTLMPLVHTDTWTREAYNALPKKQRLSTKDMFVRFVGALQSINDLNLAIEKRDKVEKETTDAKMNDVLSGISRNL